jgi:hypothetical protein
VHQRADQFITQQIQSNNPMTDKSPINFDRTIAGFNVTENGIQSYSKSFKIGPIQFTMNARSSGVRGSISLPGTGFSKRNIKFF